VLTYAQEFRAADSPWALYENGALISYFRTRFELLAHCCLVGEMPPKWTPHWLRPNTGRIVGTPYRIVGTDDGTGPLIKREDFP
jgi:hypothetical protein